MTRQSVCLFGLSADPPTGTGGHVGMVKALVKHFAASSISKSSFQTQGEPTNQSIYILPVYRHTFKSKQSRLTSFEHRLAMCRLAFANVIPSASANSIRVQVSEAERLAFEWAMQRNKTSFDQEQAAASFGTATLLDYLREHDNGGAAATTERQYSLALGADTFCDLVQGKWKESQRVLQTVDHFYVFDRKQGIENDSSLSLQDCLRKVGDKATLLQVDSLQDVSSSKARECTSIDQLKEMVPAPVVEYILKHGLYAIGEKQHALTTKTT
ncbi:hypothetical protein MPSEU_000166100 [Mayamaea pseudoterrestris]|nr:hypothetical protein MPSEU_000166100 [Mayamaea pseudoterrestris]